MNTKPYHSYHGNRHLWLKIIAVLAALGVLCFAVLEALVCWGAYHQVYDDPQAVIILGCQVKETGPSVLLKDRLDTALDYLEDHTDLPVVVSGGQGPDEPTTEAQCMYDYLTDNGIDGARIYQEDQSHNTSQNLIYSKEILEELGLDLTQDNVLIVSNGFHLTRTRMLADRYGYETVSTLAAPVSHTPSAVKMFFREPLALAKSFLLD